MANDCPDVSIHGIIWFSVLCWMSSLAMSFILCSSESPRKIALSFARGTFAARPSSPAALRATFFRMLPIPADDAAVATEVTAKDAAEEAADTAEEILGATV